MTTEINSSGFKISSPIVHQNKDQSHLLFPSRPFPEHFQVFNGRVRGAGHPILRTLQRMSPAPILAETAISATGAALDIVASANTATEKSDARRMLMKNCCVDNGRRMRDKYEKRE